MDKQWDQYLNAVGGAKHPESTSRYETSSSEKEKTGFHDLEPQRPDLQARYDAMSAEWEGVYPTDQAMIQGLFSSEPAEVDKSLPERK